MAQNCWTSSAVCLLLLNLWSTSAWAQEPSPKLEIVVLEGEGAINNLRDQSYRPAVVQVQDENQKPIAGASVVFFLPDQGPGGAFFDGTRSLTLTTDAQGRAAVRGLRFNRLSGQMKIRAVASYRGQTATATITQTNVGGPQASPGLGRTAKILIIAGIAAGVTVGAILATRGGSGSSSSAGVPPITITAGTPTVGAP